MHKLKYVVKHTIKGAANHPWASLPVAFALWGYAMGDPAGALILGLMAGVSFLFDAYWRSVRSRGGRD